MKQVCTAGSQSRVTARQDVSPARRLPECICQLERFVYYWGRCMLYLVRVEPSVAMHRRAWCMIYTSTDVLADVCFWRQSFDGPCNKTLLYIHGSCLPTSF